MTLLDELYINLYGELEDYCNKLKQNIRRLETVSQAFDAKCAINDRELSAKIQANSRKQSEFELRAAQLASELNKDECEDRQRKDDEYLKIFDQLSDLRREGVRIQNEHDIKRQNLGREFKQNEYLQISENVRIKEGIRRCLDSLECRRFAFAINSDRELFENKGGVNTTYLNNSGYISIGVIRAPIPVHTEFQEQFSEVFQESFDEITRTLALPVGIDIKRGQIIVIEYTQTTEDIMNRGIENLRRNVSRYNDGYEVHKKRLIEIPNFITGENLFDILEIKKVCEEAFRAGDIVVLTYSSAAKSDIPREAEEIFLYIKNMSMNIESGVGGFFMKTNNRNNIAAFKWYQAFETKEDEENVETDLEYDEVPVVVEEKIAAFADKALLMKTYIDSHREDLLNEDITLIFAGEPGKKSELLPIEVKKAPLENILLLSNDGNMDMAVSIAMSVVKSLKMQETSVELWGMRRSAVFERLQELSTNDLMIRGKLETICKQIKDMRKNILEGRENKKFFVLVGFEVLFLEMFYQNQQNAFVSAALASYRNSLIGGNNSEIYDAREDLKFLLTCGPGMGYHFVMVFNNEEEFERSGIDVALFRHKITRLPEGGFRYNNGMDEEDIKPYLHKGLVW